MDTTKAANELARNATVDAKQTKQAIADIEARCNKTKAASDAVRTEAAALEIASQRLASHAQELKQIFNRIDLLHEATKQVNLSVDNVAASVTRAETYMRKAEAKDVVPVEFVPPKIYQTKDLNLE